MSDQQLLVWIIHAWVRLESDLKLHDKKPFLLWSHGYISNYPAYLIFLFFHAFRKGGYWHARRAPEQLGRRVMLLLLQTRSTACHHNALASCRCPKYLSMQCAIEIRVMQTWTCYLGLSMLNFYESEKVAIEDPIEKSSIYYYVCQPPYMEFMSVIVLL